MTDPKKFPTRIKARRCDNGVISAMPIDRDSMYGDVYAEYVRVDMADPRLCVTCGRSFPQLHPRNAPGEGCETPEICAIDMTLREALEHWRNLAHVYYERARRAEDRERRLTGEPEPAPWPYSSSQKGETQ